MWDPGPTARRLPRGVLGGGAALLVALGVTTGLLLDRAAGERDRRSRAEAAVVRAQAARARRVQAPHRGRAPALRPAAGASPARRRAARAALVAAVEQAITRDARARVARGELDGPMRGTDCGPLLRDEGAVPDDRVLARRIGRYDCVAVRRAIVKRGKVVGTLGHAFVAALDFRDFSYVWCRNLPPPGERAEALAVVPLQPACLATGGARLGTGYADTSGR